MKRKIGKLYNKAIVDGDINLKTPNEIHKDELLGGGGNTRNEIEYFKTPNGFVLNTQSCIYKYSTNDGVFIDVHPHEEPNMIFAIGYTPIYLNGVIYYTFKEYMAAYTGGDINGEEFNIVFSQACIPITKEEFYSIPIDKLTLQNDNHTLVIDFIKGIYTLDNGESSVLSSSLANVTGSLFTIEEIFNNVKYETNLNHYVEYRLWMSGGNYEDFTYGRVKTNGIGPDKEYTSENYRGADGYKHSRYGDVKLHY